MEHRLSTYAIVFVATLGVSAVLTPFAMRLARRIGFLDRPSPGKFHALPTPYLGGLAITAAVVLAAVVPGHVRLQTLAILGAAVLVGLVGLADDRRPLSLATRLASQVAAAGVLWVAGVHVTTGVWPADLALTVVTVIVVTNAFNLLDNMDGVAAGTAAVAAAFLFVVAFEREQTIVSLLAAAVSGACLGFLPFNFGGARIFLGDGGSLFLGFVLATLGISLDLPGMPFVTRAAVPMLVLAVPLFDVGLVVLSRRRSGRAVLRGGTDHTAHRLVARGATPTATALIVYVAAIATGGLALVVARSGSAAVALAALGVTIVLGIGAGWWLERAHLTSTPAQTG